MPWWEERSRARTQEYVEIAQKDAPFGNKMAELFDFSKIQVDRLSRFQSETGSSSRRGSWWGFHVVWKWEVRDCQWLSHTSICAAPPLLLFLCFDRHKHCCFPRLHVSLSQFFLCKSLCTPHCYDPHHLLNTSSAQKTTLFILCGSVMKLQADWIVYTSRMKISWHEKHLFIP